MGSFLGDLDQATDAIGNPLSSSNPLAKALGVKASSGVLGEIQNPAEHLGNDTRNATGLNPAPAADESAYDEAAGVARDEWADYQSTFQPLEKVLASQVDNPAYQGGQINQAVTGFNQAFTSSQGTNQRTEARLGISMNAQEQQSYNRLQDESQTLGDITAVNRTARGLRDQEYYVLGGGSLSTPALPQLSNGA